MPTAAIVALTGLGLCGVILLGLGLAAVIVGGSTLAASGGLLGVAELIVIGRVVERRQSARIAAVTLAILQAALGVAFIATGNVVGIFLIPLAGLVVVPLSTESVEHFFQGPP
jgi:hypothetical protein